MAKRGQKDSAKHMQVQRNFVGVNFELLTVLIVCQISGAVFYTINFLISENVSSPYDLIVNLKVDNLLYLEVLLDPFLYAWRMPKYRESLSKIIYRKNNGRESNRSRNEKKLAAGENRDGRLIVNTVTKQIGNNLNKL